MGEEWVAAVVSIVFFLTVGSVILFRPVARRLGDYLEVLIEEKRRASGTPRAPDLRRALEGLEQRLRLVEERLEFTENLLERRGPEASLGPESEADGGVSAPGEGADSPPGRPDG